MMTADQTILLLDKEQLWRKYSHEGVIDLREYNGRAADALRALFDRASAAESRAQALEAKVARLEGALTPFAKFADIPPFMVGRGENTHPSNPKDEDRYHHSHNITWGHMRRARAALEDQP